jgi:Cu/Ag efflux protein CusF
MKQLTLGLILLTGMGLVQAATHEHAMNHNMQQEAAPHEMQTTHKGMGVVKAVKPGKVQIAHEPIDSLGWPAMTMWFEITGQAGELKAGQQVRFTLEPKDGKKWIIREIEPTAK